MNEMKLNFVLLIFSRSYNDEAYSYDEASNDA
jgi:hypothetical protein